MSIAVIIVNYNAAQLAAAAVQSILSREHGGRQVDIHLLDNASTEDDVSYLQAAHDQESWGERVRIWPETENHGFGRGNTKVLKALSAQEVPPEFVFLLNPDAVLENEAIDILAETLEADPKLGAVGAGVRTLEDEGRVAAFRFPTARQAFSQALDFGPFTRLLRAKATSFPADAPAGKVDWVTGAAVMFRLKAVREVGYFDPVFFLYFEEVELMHRMTGAGWGIFYQPAARVVHHEGMSTKVQEKASNRRRPAYVYRSWRHFYTKTYGKTYALGTALGVWIFATIGVLIAKIRRRPHRLAAGFFKDHWRYALSPLLGLSCDQTYEEDLARFGAKKTTGLTNENPPGIGFWALVAEDFRTHEKDIFSQGFWALFWHRFGNWRIALHPLILRAPFSILYRVAHKMTQWVCGIDLPYSVIVGRRVKLEHFGGMILVAKKIGDDVVIRQNTTFGISGVRDLEGRPIIGNRVDIGAGAAVIGAAVVGDDVVIGANAVVVGNVEPGSIIGGVPARVIGRVNDKKDAQ